jgi:acylphosphatase
VKRVRVFAGGRVQGVFFRETTRRRAAELGVRGWVRNRPDGRVEAVFEGKDRAVDEAIEFMKMGPPLATVEEVEIVDEPPSGDFKRFEVR